ncbi:MAG: hypothetical protein I8H68_05915 [Flavobacteriia bacterium]|nr:hypothetical protein [Flavobacteriia bacterium]
MSIYRKLSFLLFLGINSFYFSQIKLNKEKGVDIILEDGHLVIGQNDTAINYKISNNSDVTYIIDPMGFYGTTYVTENNKILTPNVIIRSNHYNRDNIEVCKEDIIILYPKKTIYKIIMLDQNNRNVYKYSRPNTYLEIIKSVHNDANAKRLGCENYIEELKNKGYVVLNDEINAQIPLKFK